MLTILGIIYAKSYYAMRNWDLALQKFTDVLNSLKEKELFIYGRQLAVKTKCLPQLMAVAKVFPLPRTVEQRVTQKTESFLVRHREVKLPILTLPLSEGGIGAIHSSLYCKALYVDCNIKYAIDNNLEVGALQLQPLLLSLGVGVPGVIGSRAPNIFQRDVARISEELGLERDGNLGARDIHRECLDRLRAGMELPMFPCDVVKLWQNCHSGILEHNIP